MRRRPACKTLLKDLDILSATACISPDLLKALAILLDRTFRRTAVGWDDQIPYWKSDKTTILEAINKPVIYKFFKDATDHRKKTNRTVVFSHRPLPIILKPKRDLPTTWKTKFLQTLMEEFGYYVLKFTLTVFRKHHRNTIRTRCLWQIKVGYDLLNQLGSYMNVMQFQISPRRKNR